MNDTVAAALALSFATLKQETPYPAGELGYGTDVATYPNASGLIDANDALDDVNPLSVAAIGQALLRRLTTKRGTLPDDPNYGLDLRAYCNRGIPVERLRDVAGQTRLELSKDDRVTSCTVTVTQPDPSTLRVEAVVTPAVIGLAPFALVFAVTPTVIVLEQIT